MNVEGLKLRDADLTSILMSEAYPIIWVDLSLPLTLALTLIRTLVPTQILNLAVILSHLSLSRH